MHAHDGVVRVVVLVVALVAERRRDARGLQAGVAVISDVIAAAVPRPSSES